MQALPHLYNVSASSTTTSTLNITSQGLNDLEMAPPAEFGGPGDLWSPETIFMSAISSCYILSFKAVSRASKLEWKSLTCESIGTLDRDDKTTRFTKIVNKVTLTITTETSETKARKLLEKAEHICLITNSLNAELSLECEIIVS